MPIRHALLVVLLLVGCASEASAQESDQEPRHIPRETENGTALDKYVAKSDDSFSWRVVARRQRAGATELVVDLTSLTWRTKDEVDRTEWKHWMTLVVPEGTTADTALLVIGGGGNGPRQPDGASGMSRQIALATKSVVVELKTVPNQPLVFAGSERLRFEDGLLAASWNKFLETEDPTWIAQLPMTKSAVAAMTATQQIMNRERSADGEEANQSEWPKIDKFVVTGASKRGWTSWLTAAVDKRVVGVAPIVIDLLNMTPSMRHHRQSLGEWSPTLDDYREQGITKLLGSEEIEPLLAIIDPFVYRERLTIPKCMINASQDEFFLPDSSRFYFAELVGEKHLSYTPNSGHDVRGSNAFDTLVAFHASIVHGFERPTIKWSGDHTSDRHVITTSRPATEARLYRAVNAEARDFRLSSIGPSYKSTEIEPNDKGEYVVEIERVEKGYSATFVRFNFDIGARTPFRISTPVWIAPDTMPGAQ